MNTYQDNLRTVTGETLTQLSQEQQKMNVQNDTAESNLYYDQGTRLTAENKLAQADIELGKASRLYTQGGRNNNIATNLLTTATRTQTQVATTVTNMATAAGDVQIATNAIAKLASDIGGVFNILDCADYGTDIYNLGVNANKLIGQTAYNAEQASQKSMEATASTSEISSGAVKDDATKTETEVKQLYGVTQSELQNASTVRDASEKKLETASVQEKGAQGKLQDAHALFEASNKAYSQSNEQLNLKLKVSGVTYPINKETYELNQDNLDDLKKQNVPKETIDALDKLKGHPYTTQPDFLEAMVENKVDFGPGDIYKEPIFKAALKLPDFNVQFSSYEAPFPTKSTKDSKSNIPYPVQSYKVFVVPSSQSATFQLAQAESIVTEGYSNRYVNVQVLYQLTNDSYEALKKEYSTDDPKDQEKLKNLETLKGELFNSDEELNKAFAGASLDLANVESEPVVKIKDDIVIQVDGATNTANIPMGGSVKDSGGNDIELGKTYVVFLLIELNLTYQRYINSFSNMLSLPSQSFTLTEKLPKAAGVSWETSSIYKLTTESLVQLKIEGIPLKIYSELQSILNKEYESEEDFWSAVTETVTGGNIEEYKDRIEYAALEGQGYKLIFTIDGHSYINTSPEPAGPGENKVQYRCIFLEKKSSLTKVKNDSVPLLTAEDLINECDCCTDSDSSCTTEHPAVYFNTRIAEQVTEANYTVAQNVDPGDSGNSQIRVFTEMDTTDNFGNPLKKGIKENYLPAILAVADVEGDDVSKYTSHLSYPVEVSEGHEDTASSTGSDKTQEGDQPTSNKVKPVSTKITRKKR